MDEVLWHLDIRANHYFGRYLLYTTFKSAPGGNDFGIDDISFATLSTFLNLESADGTDAQTVCVNSPLTNIVYSFGNGNSNPTVSALPTGVSVTFAGDRLTISGTPTVPGNYSYTITTTGCAPFTITGTITVQGQKITLSSGSCFANCLCKYTCKYWLYVRRYCNRCNSHRLSCCRPHADCFRHFSNSYRNAHCCRLLSLYHYNHRNMPGH